MKNDLEDPRISYVRDYGLPEAPERDCPCCDSRDIGTIFYNIAFADAVGCEDCVDQLLAADVEEDIVGKYWECPICDNKLKLKDIKSVIYYRTEDKEIVGCSKCVREMDAEEFYADY